jgi:hypothetical protein
LETAEAGQPRSPITGGRGFSAYRYKPLGNMAKEELAAVEA